MGSLATVPVGAALLAAGALLPTAAMRVRGAAAFVVAAMVVGASEIVALSIALSLIDALEAGWMLAGQALVAVGAAGWWLAADRPALPRPAGLGRGQLVASARAHPAVALLAGAAGLTLALQLVIGVVVVPNNWDSMTYHLARVAYWLQQDSAEHFHAGTFRQLSYPPNGELLQAWTFLVSGSERLANLVQWTALVGLACAVYECARLLDFGRAAAIFAASLLVVLPQPVMQSTTPQNDLIVAFFLTAALTFGLRGLRNGWATDLALAGVALGLAVGAKGTALMALPPLALLVALGLRAFRPSRRTLAVAAGAGVAGVLLLGSFNYILNLQTYNGLLGPADDSVKRHSAVPANSVRVGWELADLPGVQTGWLSLLLDKSLRHTLGDLKSDRFPGYVIGSEVQEDVAAYGPVGMFVLLPLLLLVLLRGRAPPRRALALAALVYLAVFMLLKEWDPWVGRLLLPVVAMAAPLFAVLHGREWLRTTCVVAAFVGLAPCLLVNQEKTLLSPSGKKTVLGLDRLQQQTIIRPDMYTPQLSLRTRVSPTDPVGLVRSGDSWDYSFFGSGLKRRVVPLEAAEAGQAAIRRHGLAGIVYANITPPARLRAKPLGPGYWFVPRRG